MNKFQLYKKIYRVDHVIVGSRVDRSKIKNCLHDEMLVDQALAKLYTECPTKFPGENKNEKHYLLNDGWEILHMFLITCDIIKKHPAKAFKYINWLIEDLRNLKSDREFYMDPTKINR